MNLEQGLVAAVVALFLGLWAALKVKSAQLFKAQNELIETQQAAQLAPIEQQTEKAKEDYEKAD